MKTQKIILLTIIIPLFFSLMSFSCASTQTDQDNVLFSEKDAGELDLNQLSEKDWYAYINYNLIGTRGKASEGPLINIKQPTVKMAAIGPTIETQSPINLIVSFGKSASGKPADMDSLEVIGKKGIFTKKLTNKLRPYIIDSQINAPNLAIPNGKFHLQVKIADTAGVETVENYLLLVK